MNREQTLEQLRRMLASEAALLRQLKHDATHFGDHSDWPWIGLVLSAATRGGSWRWEKSVKPRYESELSWSAISQITAIERRRRLETVGRFWRKTATWLEQAFAEVESAGGPMALRDKLDLMPASDVIAYWKSINDVKDKYARNIMMDIYHPKFREDFFAIDSRLESLLPILGYVGKRDYLSKERFLVELARDVGVDAWDLDRLLYIKHSELKQVYPINEV